MANETDIRPFRVDMPDEAIADLRRRIAATRWPSRELVADRSQGVQLATVQELARYWAAEYDWHACEARLNALPQFKTGIDGLDIHFIHVRSRHENALPLIMTHGWPGSVIELLETVGPLTNPAAHGGSAEDAFHLVLPSIPGYGFSAEPAEIGWYSGRVAQAWAELMRRLGYTRYVAQGGDQGASVTDAMGRQAPGGLIGIHTNLLVTAVAGPEPAETDEERAAAGQLATFRQSGFGYFLEQATRPQTIGYALLDSPVALAGWMLDHDTDSYYKISRAFVDGQPSGGLTRDHILDNITLYWLTRTGASAARTVPGSVARLEPLTLGGVRQWLLVRGRRAESPVLLKLHGGPGQAEMATAGLNGLLEKDFVVAEWDQRGSGKSAAAIRPARAMTVSQLVADTIELAEHLTRRFGGRKLIVVGHSWGSVLGLMAVRRRPDLFSAFVSTGLIANFAEGQQVAYRFLLAEAGRRGNTKAFTELSSLGSPPYAGAEGIAKWRRCARWLGEFGALWHSSEKFDRVGWMLGSIEYSWPEKLRFNRAAERSFGLLYADLLSVNLSETVPRVEVPVFFAEGRHDRMAPAEVAERYFTSLIAPGKELVWFENSAHFPQWEERARFHEFLLTTVLPATAV